MAVRVHSTFLQSRRILKLQYTPTHPSTFCMVVLFIHCARDMGHVHGVGALSTLVYLILTLTTGHSSKAFTKYRSSTAPAEGSDEKGFQML